ncbi:hypothetical protein TNCV_2298311 [Trichonephila clavipes]|nr:hypothetical protein TNCV_2298311 [Trichonephila clavipes]
MSYECAACKGFLECLFGLGILGKIKLFVRFRVVRVLVPFSGIDPVVLTKAEATEILGRDGQRPGTYLLYEDVEKERICLSFR